MNTKKTFVAAAALPIALAFAAPAHAFDIGSFFKGVGNVLTGGLLGLAEGAAKVAKTGKVTPKDILNFATGGAAGAVKDAIGTAHKTTGLVKSAVGGIVNSVRDVVSRLGGNLPGLGKMVGSKGGPLGMLGAFGKTFTSSLGGLFAGGVKKLGLRPGQGLFKTGFGLINQALAKAKAAALAFGKKAGIRLPSLGGVTQFFQTNVKKAFDLGRKVALNRVKRVSGQFRALVRPGSVKQVLTKFVKVLPPKFQPKKR